MGVRKRIIAGVVAAASALGVLASASTLGGITATAFGSSGTAIVSCDTNGVSVTYNLAVGAPSRVNSVTVRNLAMPCRGRQVKVTLADAAGTSLGYGMATMPNTGSIVTVPMVAPVLSSQVGRVAIVASASSALPSAPGTPTAVARDRSVTLNWNAPASIQPITGYQVESPTRGLVCSTVAPVRTCNVTGLTNGTAYQFRVRAITSDGAGAWSGYRTVTPNLPAPGTPTAVTSDRAVVLTWTAPAAASPILSYQVQSPTLGTVCTPTSNTCTVTGLTNGTAYQFRVRAVTSAGTGLWSGYRTATPAVRAMNVFAACTPAADFPGYRRVRVNNPNVLAQPFTLQQTTTPTQPVTSGSAANGNTYWLVKVTGSPTTSYTVRLLSGTVTNRTVGTGFSTC